MLADVVVGATVELSYAPNEAADPPHEELRSASGAGPPGWQVTVIVHPNERIARLVTSGDGTALAELLDSVPWAGVRAVAPFRALQLDGGQPLGAALRRTLGDTVAQEVLAIHLASRIGSDSRSGLIGETIDYLLELGGTRVESHELTHGVLLADVFHDTPRLDLAYPADIRAAKRAPLLFDGQRSVLLVDTQGPRASRAHAAPHRRVRSR